MKENVKVFAKTIEDEAQRQIEELSKSDAYKDCKIRVMPDVHAGTGCTIGTVIKIRGRVIPNTVGVDIGCGMLVICLGKDDVNLERLDEVINNYIPSGFSVNDTVTDFVEHMGSGILDGIKAKCFDTRYALRSIGTLGGGNHFIEIDVDEEGLKYLVIHSGSRNLGVSVCKYYQEAAYKNCSIKKDNRKSIIERLKEEGREKEIQEVLSSLPKFAVPNKDLCYLDGSLLDDYFSDMKLVQKYADFNRKTIAMIIMGAMEKKVFNTLFDKFTTLHNYIELSSGILRKGAIAAYANRRVIIPMNMRDGSLLCVGKGNDDWLCSAPHGAGRLMSRTRAKMDLKLDDFRKQMDGIYTTSVCTETIDESPMAYKPMDEIVELIKPTVNIVKVIKPIYNFKAKE